MRWGFRDSYDWDCLGTLPPLPSGAGFRKRVYVKQFILNRGIPTLRALGAGYSGSTLHAWFNHGKPLGTIRAPRFELIDESGGQASTGHPTSGPERPERSEPVLVFADPRGIRRCELGMNAGDSAPFLRFYGDDSAERVGVSLVYHSDPVLLLRDGYRIRAALGAPPGDAFSPAEDEWGLSARARTEGPGANIGFLRWWDRSCH